MFAVCTLEHDVHVRRVVLPRRLIRHWGVQRRFLVPVSFCATHVPNGSILLPATRFRVPHLRTVPDVRSTMQQLTGARAYIIISMMCMDHGQY